MPLPQTCLESYFYRTIRTLYNASYQIQIFILSSKGRDFYEDSSLA